MAGNIGERRMLIDGKLVDSSNGNTFDNINPATEDVLGPVADGTKEDMNRAIDAARRAFDETENAIPVPLSTLTNGLARMFDPLDVMRATFSPQYEPLEPLDVTT